MPVRRAKRGQVRAIARRTASTVYREAIAGAAMQAFTDHGYAATKMVDIARRAGMSVGALYQHFNNKEAIFVSIMEEASEQLITRMRGVAGAVVKPAERLAKLIETMLRFVEENRGMFLVFHQLADADRARCHSMVEMAESTRDDVLAMYRAAIGEAIAAKTLRSDVAIDDQLAFVTGTVHGFLEAWIRSDGKAGLVVKAPLIADLTLRALGRHS
jgi:AcrR family transcriptional regulator